MHMLQLLHVRHDKANLLFIVQMYTQNIISVQYNSEHFFIDR